MAGTAALSARTGTGRVVGSGDHRVSSDVRALIGRMSTANPHWGAPRIHGELLKLGIDVCQATVAQYMIRRRSPPSQTWRTFLANHVGQIVAADFFVVPTATGRLLFVLVPLAHERRRVVHVAVTGKFLIDVVGYGRSKSGVIGGKSLGCC